MLFRRFHIQKKALLQYQLMTFLLLPSSRLALYRAETRTLKTLPIRVEQFVCLQSHGKQYLSVSYLKSVFIYLKEALLNYKSGSQILPITTCAFTKKIECLTQSNGRLFASDKFGDVYEIGLDGQAKYHNSNLGIPTFLQAVSSAHRGYIAVGDQDTRIKIYNLARMHEIVSFWFLTKRVPLQLLQPIQTRLMLLVKNQENKEQSESSGKHFVQLHQVQTSSIENAEFNGQLLYVSQDVEGGLECKYQKIIASERGTVYLLKLFQTKIKIIVFNLYKQNREVEVSIQKGEWSQINGQVVIYGNRQELVMAYGKSINLQQEFDAEEHSFYKLDNYLGCVLNGEEHVIVYPI